jgi:ABC-type multidrug transport system fused ATPase/permease subunit
VITVKEVEAAAEAASLHGFIRQLFNGSKKTVLLDPF